MARQVIALGTQPFGASNDAAWEGAVALDAALVAGGAAAHIRYIEEIAGSIRIRLAPDQTSDPPTAGPEFSASVETLATALTFSETGGGSVGLKGPAHADNTFADNSEPYYWTPDNSAAWTAWVRGLGSGAVTLTINDTPPAPLALSDRDTGGETVEAAALLSVSGQPTLYADLDRGGTDAPLEGELGIGAGETAISRVRRTTSSGGVERLSLLDDDNPQPLDLGTYFAAGGDGRDLTLVFQTRADVIRLDVADRYLYGGTAFVHFELTATEAAVIDALPVGDRFILAFTRPALAAPIDLAGRAVAGVPVARGALDVAAAPPEPVDLAGRAVSGMPAARGALAIFMPAPVDLAGHALAGAPAARAALRTVRATPVEPADLTRPVMALAGDRWLGGPDSATQRLRDALVIQRGSYPVARDYGSTLTDVLDRPLHAGGQAALMAAVADAVAHRSNGLDDVRLRSVAVRTEDGVTTLDIRADWVSESGAITPIGLREQLAG